MKLRELFAAFLENGGYCTPPGRAACALSSAKTVLRFREMEDVTVRLSAEPDPEPWDAGDCDKAYTNIHGRKVSAEESKRELDELIERTGNWHCVAEYLDANGEWQHADSIGGCAGYENVLDPLENCYIVDLMNAAIDARDAVVDEANSLGQFSDELQQA